MGVYRPALELDPGANENVSVRFAAIPRGQWLEVSYGLPDDRLQSKFLPLRDQRLSVTLGDREVAMRSVPYVVGWGRLTIPVPPGRPSSATITVYSNGTHFPIAIDARVVGTSR
jgi:hypothetical protein